MKEIVLNEDELADIFQEWDRRYRNDPESFENEAKRLLNGTPYTYGRSASKYFINLLDEMVMLQKL